MARNNNNDNNKTRKLICTVRDRTNLSCSKSEHKQDLDEI